MAKVVHHVKINFAQGWNWVGVFPEWSPIQLTSSFNIASLRWTTKSGCPRLGPDFQRPDFGRLFRALVSIINCYHYVGQCGAFCLLKWRICWPTMYLIRWNKPMKSENQIIVRCKHPINIEKPWQSLLPFSYSIGERNIRNTASLFLFTMPSKVITIVK